MAGDGHAEAMRLGDDCPNDGRREEVVQLDLFETEVVVSPHDGASLLRRRGIDRSERVGTAAVHQAGYKRSRPEGAVCSDCVAKGDDEVQIISHVSHGRHARGEVHGSPLHLHDVGVHIPQAGHDRLSSHVNPARAARHGRRCARTRRDDPSTGDDDSGIGHRRRTGAVDEGSANERYGAGGERCNRVRHAREIRHAVARAAGHQGGQVRLEPFPHCIERQAAAGGRDRRQATGAVQPH